MTVLNLFIGYDPRQPVAFHAAAHSAWTHCTAPLSITRLQLNQLPITRKGLTEFTYSRFLCPWLMGFEGVGMFIDSDVLVRGDLVELLAYPMAYPEKAVFVVQHERKFEWPSVMVFNNPLCKQLTPEYVAKAKLFDFAWADEVGSLPSEWNHLVGYDAPNPAANLVHFTQGVPCWPETKGSEFAEEWLATVRELKSSVSFHDLMGRSVHVPYVAKRLAAARPRNTQ